MFSTAPATSFIHKTSHKRALKSPRHRKWASMHINIAWQIYYKEQQKEIQLKSKSWLCDFEAKDSLDKAHPCIYRHTTESRLDKLHPYQFCNGMGKYEQQKKLVCDFKTCNYIWKPRDSEFPTLYPSFFKDKRQTQEVQEDFWSHATSDKKAVFFSNSGNWINNLQPIYSPSANPINQHQVPSMLTCVKLEGTNRSLFYPPVLTQDFKHKTFNQAVEQNCNVQRLWMPPASLWTHGNSLFGSPNL